MCGQVEAGTFSSVTLQCDNVILNGVMECVHAMSVYVCFCIV